MRIDKLESTIGPNRIIHRRKPWSEQNRKTNSSYKIGELVNEVNCLNDICSDVGASSSGLKSDAIVVPTIGYEGPIQVHNDVDFPNNDIQNDCDGNDGSNNQVYSPIIGDDDVEGSIPSVPYEVDPTKFSLNETSDNEADDEGTLTSTYYHNEIPDPEIFDNNDDDDCNSVRSFESGNLDPPEDSNNQNVGCIFPVNEEDFVPDDDPEFSYYVSIIKASTKK